MITGKLLYNGIPNIKHGLKAVAKRELNIELDKEQQASDWGAAQLNEQIDYAAKGVEVLMALDVPLHRKFRSWGYLLAYAMSAGRC